MTATKQDVSALAGMIGALGAQFWPGLSTTGHAVTILGGLGVIAIHQLTAFARKEAPVIGADLAKDFSAVKSQIADHTATITTLAGDLAVAKKQLADVVTSANAALNNIGAQVTAHASELDGIRRTLAAQAPDAPAPTSIQVPTVLTTPGA